MTKKIYIAGALFSEAEKLYLEYLVGELSEALGLNLINDFFLPHRDVGDLGISGDKSQVFYDDLYYLNHAEIIVAVLDGTDVDSGTALELGYSYGCGKTIFGLRTDKRSFLNNMIWGVCGNGSLIFENIEDLIVAILDYMGN